MTDSDEVVIIGVGNYFRSDDAVGLYVARMFGLEKIPGLRVVEGIGDGTDLINAWDGVETVCVIDSVKAENCPGRIYRFDGLKEPIPEKLGTVYSTHAFRLTDAIEMARTVGRLPRRLIVYGIEGADFSHGKDLSPEVRRAAEGLIDGIKREIRDGKS